MCMFVITAKAEEHSRDDETESCVPVSDEIGSDRQEFSTGSRQFAYIFERLEEEV